MTIVQPWSQTKAESNNCPHAYTNSLSVQSTIPHHHAPRNKPEISHASSKQPFQRIPHSQRPKSIPSLISLNMAGRSGSFDLLVDGPTRSRSDSVHTTSSNAISGGSGSNSADSLDNLNFNCLSLEDKYIKFERNFRRLIRLAREVLSRDHTFDSLSARALSIPNSTVPSAFVQPTGSANLKTPLSSPTARFTSTSLRWQPPCRR